MKLTYNQYKAWLRTNKRIEIDGKKYNSSTIVNYVEYTDELITNHNIKKAIEINGNIYISGIQLRDYSLMNKYGITDLKHYTKMMTKLGIAECVDTHWKHMPYDDKNGVCKKYKIDINRLADVADVAYDKHSQLYPGMYTKVTYHLPSSPTSPTSPAPTSYTLPSHTLWAKTRKKYKIYPTSIQITEFDKEYYMEKMREYLEFEETAITREDIEQTETYRLHRNWFEQIDNKNPYNFDEMWFSLKYPISATEKDILRSHYHNHIVNNNEDYQECLKLIKKINQTAKYPIRMGLHVDIKGTKYLGLKPSCRQYNDLCGIESSLRNKMLEDMGYAKFDLHSAIFAVARAKNKGIFDVDWDLKRDMFEDWNTYDTETKSDIKEVLNRCFFCSFKEAYSKYKNDRIENKQRLLTKDCFTEIYDEVQAKTGGTKEYQGNIFLYESYLELKIMEAMIDSGKEVLNVFDCFWYKKDEITEEQFKDLVQKIAEEVLF